MVKAIIETSSVRPTVGSGSVTSLPIWSGEVTLTGIRAVSTDGSTGSDTVAGITTGFVLQVVIPIRSGLVLPSSAVDNPG